MTIYLAEMLDRLVELEKRAITTPDNRPPVAVPYAAYAQDSYPYWTNLLGNVSIVLGAGLNSSIRYYTVIMRLHVGHVDQDYIGENEVWAARWIEEVFDYFEARPMLQRFIGDTVPAMLHEQGCRIIGCSGLIYPPSLSGSVQQVRLDFTMNIPIRYRRETLV